MTATPSVTDLYRYPVKGLSPEPLATVTLETGQGVPLDREFAIARQNVGDGATAPGPLPKTRFHMLMLDEALAALSTRFDDPSRELVIAKDGKELLRASIDTPDGQSEIETFVASHLNLPADAAPKVSRFDGHRFTDVSVVSPTHMNAISLINLASVRALEDKVGRDVHPLRFRGNVYFDGGPAWEEFDWMEREFTIGAVRLRGIMRTRRCPATQVNPLTAERDIDVPEEIKKHFGHADMGIYAEVLRGGPIRPGDAIAPA